MVPRQQVIDYISSNLRGGYDLPSIRSRLISSGYEPAEINAAIDVIRSGKTSAGRHAHLGTYTILAIAIIGFLLIGGVATVFFRQASQTSAFSDSGSGSSSFSNSGVSSAGNNGNVAGVGSSQSSQSASSSASSSSATSAGGSTTSGNAAGTSSFANSGSSSGSSSTADSSGRSIPAVDYGSSSTDANTALTTRLAIENKVNSLAASQPAAAAQLCGQINTVAGQDSCFNTVAQNSEQSQFCTQISDSDAADACLTSLALKQVEDVNLCKQMKSEIRFRQCVLLYDSQSQLDTVQKAAADVQTAPALSAPQQPLSSDIDAAYSVNLDDIGTISVVASVNDSTTGSNADNSAAQNLSETSASSDSQQSTNQDPSGQNANDGSNSN